MRLQTIAGRLRTGHGRSDPMGHFLREQIDKVIYRRTGADTDDRVGLDVFDGGFGSGAFLIFGCHGFTGCVASDQL